MNISISQASTGRWVLAIGLILPSLMSAQTASKPPLKPVLLPQAFQRNIQSTENLTPSVENPNVFSPWYDVINDLNLPADFDFQGAAAAAAVGQAEAAADAISRPAEDLPDVAFSDLPIENDAGAFLAYPKGTAFNPESLLLTPGGGGFAMLSQEATLDFGSFTYPVESVPRGIPIFNRERKLTQVGPFRVGLDLTGSAAYNDNVFGVATDPQSDQILTFSPVVYLEAGTRGSIRLLYAPIFVDYLRYKELSTVNQSFFLQVRYPFSKLKIGLDGYYITQSGLFLTNDSGYTTQNTILARLLVEYPLTKMSTLALTGESVYATSDPGDPQWENSVAMRLVHRLTPKVDLGVAVRLGQVQAPVETQTYQALSFLMSYQPTVAWRFAAEVGMELRDLSLSSAGKEQLPITLFNLQATYNPTSTSIFSASLYRTALNTTFNNVSLNITTGGNLSAVAYLYQKFHLRLQMDAGRTEQISDRPDTDGAYYFIQGGITLSYPILKNLEIQIFDNIQKRFMSEIGSDYVSNTFGIAFSLEF